MADFLVRFAEGGDEAQWRDLWGQYIQFYESHVPEPVTEYTWSRILNRTDGFVGRVCEHQKRIVGISISIVHARSWTIEPACYLEDLFVDRSTRNVGIGRALIDDLISMAKQRGWARVYWHTRASNATARRLYDHYVSADDFVRYKVTST